MITQDLIGALNAPVDIRNPWSGSYKIPWNDPEFSARMLSEHLSQGHDLASRKRETISEQSAWIHQHMMNGKAGKILDLGCGPGLYSPHFVRWGHQYYGIDFGPASIDYAATNYAAPGKASFALGDLLKTDFGQAHDTVIFLYGEMNVFPQEDCLQILRKACDSLSSGGLFALEVHTMEAVRALGQGRTWFAAEAGLFTNNPHVCLQANHWIEEQNVAQQVFSVIEEGKELNIYQNTLQGYSEEHYISLLREAGFSQATYCDDWPAGSEALKLVKATK